MTLYMEEAGNDRITDDQGANYIDGGEGMIILNQDHYLAITH